MFQYSSLPRCGHYEVHSRPTDISVRHCRMTGNEVTDSDCWYDLRVGDHHLRLPALGMTCSGSFYQQMRAIIPGNDTAQ